MLSHTTEHAAVAVTTAQGATPTIDRGSVSLRRLYLPEVAAAQAAFDLASGIADATRRTNDFGAALHLCVLARMDLHEQVERAVNRGGLLHIGAPALRS